MRIINIEDSGNIIINKDNDPNNIRLAIRKDTNNEDFHQWFNFKVEGLVGEKSVLIIENADKVRFPYWNDYGAKYQATASYGNDEWFRLPTNYNPETKELTIEVILTQTEDVKTNEEKIKQLQIAFYPPYSYERHLKLINSAADIPHCTINEICRSVENRPVHLLTVNKPGLVSDSQKKHIWIIARQHPSETMAEWAMEGLVEELKSESTHFNELLDSAILHIIPNINPDGSYSGNLRTNANGIDMNREWLNPDQKRCPEVYHVREAILRTGAALFLDFHGDEGHPNFFPDGRGVGCSPNETIIEIEKEFIHLLRQRNPNLQENSCYEPDEPGKANLGLATSFFAELMNCLSVLFEMPAKGINVQNENGETELRDWTINDCKQFGRDLLAAVQTIVPKLNNQSFDEQAASKMHNKILETEKLTLNLSGVSKQYIINDNLIDLLLQENNRTTEYHIPTPDFPSSTVHVGANPYILLATLPNTKRNRQSLTKEESVQTNDLSPIQKVDSPYTVDNGTKTEETVVEENKTRCCLVM